MEKATATANEPNRQRTFLARACGVVTMLCVLIPAIFWRGGVLEREAITFIIYYADSRTLLQKIFNPMVNDFLNYQARELSYFFDYLDTTVFLFLLRHFDVTLFIPLTALVASILIILVYRRGLRQTLPNLDAVTAELLLLPFLTCFVVVSTMGLFYRSAKPLLAPVLLALLFHILRTAQLRARGSTAEKRWTIVTRRSLVTFALLLVAALLDRQGFFYVLIACLLLLVHCLITRKLKDLLVAAIAAAIVAHVYNVILGPAIIWAINSQRADFTFQRIPPEALANLPVNCLHAGTLLMANLAAMAGGYFIVGYLVLFLVIAWLAWKAIAFYKGWQPGKLWEHYTSGQSLAIFYAILILVLHIVMFSLMIARQHFLYDWIDHRYWYYPLPFLVTALFGLALLLNGVLPRLRTMQRQMLRVALVLIAVSNLLHLPAYRKEMLSSDWFGGVYAQNQDLQASIRYRWPNPDLEPEFRLFFLFHEEQRKPSK